MSESTFNISLPSISRDRDSDRFPDASPSTPPPEWQAGNQRLREQLQRLHERIEMHLHELLESIELELYDPLQSAAHEAAAIHTALVKTSHFDAPVDDVPPDLRWRRVRDYRRDTMDRVIAPLHRQLADLDLGATLHERWQTFWDDLASLPSHVPVSITRVEPDQLYVPSPEDSLLVVLRKRLVQLRRHFQVAPAPADGRFYAQEVPLRSLVAYHLRVRLPQQLTSRERALCQHLAQTVAAFERAVTTWTHRLLDAERHLDRPKHHISEHTDRPLSDGNRTSTYASPLAPSDVWAAVHAEAQALDNQLRTLSALRFDEQRTRVTSTVQDGWSALETDIDQAGSFLLARKDRTIPTTAPHEQHDRETAAQWTTWYRHVVHRLSFCKTLVALHDATYEHEDALLHALITTGLEPILARHEKALRKLRALRDEATSLFDNNAASPDALADELQTLLDRSTRVADAKLVDALREAHLPTRAKEALDECIAHLDDLFGDEPTSFLLHALAPPASDAISPDANAREVNLESIVEDHFDTFFIDALRDAVQRFRQQVEDAIHEVHHVPGGLRFNFGAALEALNDATPDDADAVTAAREFTLKGLNRSIEVIEAQAERIRAAFPPLVSTVDRAFMTAWTDLHDHARAEGQIRKHLFELRTITIHESPETSAQTAQRQLRHGPAMDAMSSGEAALRETLAALACTEQVPSNLPLTYQRLFSLRPVTDPTLLVGRRDDLTHLRHYVDRWQQGLTNALALTALPGSGLTSFLNVAQKTVLQDANVHWIRLDDRLQHASAFAKRVADALDLSLPASNEKPLTLDRVRDHLLAQPRPDAPRVCIVGPLEHLFLRTVDGTDIATRVLTFMSRTDTHILWLATASDYGWQFLNKAAPTASHLALQHHLVPIDRPTLEELIMARHRRSGLPLRFDAPEAPSPELRRRLRKARTEAHRQSALRAAYFDRLYAHCGPNLVLALFYWLRSARLDEDTLVMRIRPIHPLRFDMLERFSMEQTLVLRALLDHATLTAEEYSTVAQLPLDASLPLFESLGNALLLQPTDAQHGNAALEAVDPERRYRIRPLALHPVMQHLRERDLLP